jgi:hypothetical protein
MLKTYGGSIVNGVSMKRLSAYATGKHGLHGTGPAIGSGPDGRAP